MTDDSSRSYGSPRLCNWHHQLLLLSWLIPRRAPTRHHCDAKKYTAITTIIINILLFRTSMIVVVLRQWYCSFACFPIRSSSFAITVTTVSIMITKLSTISLLNTFLNIFEACTRILIVLSSVKSMHCLEVLLFNLRYGRQACSRSICLS